MADEGLVRYVRERLGEGYSEQGIRQALRDHGHADRQIEEAFASIHRERARRFPVALIMLLLLAGAAALLLFFLLPLGPAGPLPQEPRAAEPGEGVVAIAERLREQDASPDETYYASVQAAEESARSVPDAILLCSANREVRYKNYCLQELAESWREARLCAVIGDAQQRDDCYLGLVFLGEEQHCADLRLESGRRTCDLLLGREA